MIAEDTRPLGLHEMMAPRIVRDYLDKLQYTPVQMIGLNLFTEVASTDLVAVWPNIADPKRVQEITDGLGHRLVNTTFRYDYPDLNPLLAECIILARDAHGMQIKLVVTKAPEGKGAPVRFNGEFQDVATRRDRIDFVAEHFSDMGQTFFTFLDALRKEAP